MIKIISCWSIRSAFKNILTIETCGKEAAKIWTFSCYFGIPEMQPLFFQLFSLVHSSHSAPFLLECGIILALFSAWKQSSLHCAHDKTAIFLAHHSCRDTKYLKLWSTSGELSTATLKAVAAPTAAGFLVRFLMSSRMKRLHHFSGQPVPLFDQP